jgi:predicted Zn-dependent protease
MPPIKTQEEYKDVTYEAVELYNNHEYVTALNKFLEMRESNPKNTKIHEMLVYIYLKLGQKEKAVQEYDLLL